MPPWGVASWGTRAWERGEGSGRLREVFLPDVEDGPGGQSERLDALDVLGDPDEAQVAPGRQVGDPVRGALVDLDLHHRQVRRDGEPVLGVRCAEVEVPVPAADAAVEGDTQSRVLVAADQRLTLVAGDGGGLEVEPDHQLEDLVDEGALLRRVLDHLPLVAQLPGGGVGHGDTALLGDPVDPLLDLHADRGVVGDPVQVSVVADAQLAAELQALDLLPVEPELRSVVVEAPHAVAADGAVQVAVHPLAQLVPDLRRLLHRNQVLELVPVEGVESAGHPQRLVVRELRRRSPGPHRGLVAARPAVAGATALQPASHDVPSDRRRSVTSL